MAEVSRRSIPFSVSHGVIVVAGLLTFVLVASALADRRATIEIAVVEGDHAAGSALVVRSVEVPVDETSPVDRWVDPSDLGADAVALATLRDGDPLLASQVGVELDDQRTAVIDVERSVIEGLDLRVGSTVDVVATGDDGASFVLRDVVVVRVPSGLGDGLLSSAGEQWVAVAVDDREALALAEASEAGVHLMRSGTARS